MSLDVSLDGQRFKNTTAFLHRAAGPSLMIAAGLMVALNRNNAVRISSPWVLACAVVGLILSFALRDVTGRLGHKATEDRILKEVIAYLHGNTETAPAASVAPSEGREAAPSQTAAALPANNCMPRQAAGFLAWQQNPPVRLASQDLVVFDAMPPRRSIELKIDLFAVLMPVR